MAEWFGSTWPRVGFVAISTAATYLSVVFAIRLAGRRTLARMSAFDVVVTIALGSMLATTALSSDPSYAEGMTAVATMLVLQVLVGMLRRHSPFLRRLFDFGPLVIVRDGEADLSSSLTGHQLTETELRSALREHGVFDVGDAALVILEPDGSFSVKKQGSDGSGDG